MRLLLLPLCLASLLALIGCERREPKPWEPPQQRPTGRVRPVAEQSNRAPAWVATRGDRTIRLMSVMHRLQPGSPPTNRELLQWAYEADVLFTEIDPAQVRRTPRQAVIGLTAAPGATPPWQGLAMADRLRMDRQLRRRDVPQLKLRQLTPLQLQVLLESLEHSHAAPQLPLGPSETAAEHACWRNHECRREGLEGPLAFTSAVRLAPADEQRRILALHLRDPAAQAAAMLAIERAWVAGDHSRLETLLAADRQRLGPVLTPVFLNQRNAAWAARLDSASARADDIFVLAGVAHFYGPGNLRDQLRTRGFRVRAVTPTALPTLSDYLQRKNEFVLGEPVSGGLPPGGGSR